MPEIYDCDYCCYSYDGICLVEDCFCGSEFEPLDADEWYEYLTLY